MTTKLHLASAAGLALLMCTMAEPAAALSAKECSAKFQSAKEAGTLKGQSWAEFRKTNCAAEKAAVSPSTNPLRSEAPAKPAKQSNAANAVFPKAIAAEFASLKPAQARRKTCAQQFQANKATKANGDLRWLEAGGGYYSECNKRLKGA